MTSTMNRETPELTLDGAKTWSKDMWVSPETAQSWMVHKLYPRQRQPREWHIEELVEAIQQDKFQSGTMTLVVLPDGREYFMDGQHRLHAIARTGKGQLMTIKWIAVKDEEEANDVYIRLAGEMPRSDYDVLRASGLIDTLGLPLRGLNALRAATTFIYSGFSVTRGLPALRSRERRLQLMQEWVPELRQLIEATQGSHGLYDAFFNRGVLSVALVTLRFQSKRAVEFWRQVAHHDSLPTGSGALHAYTVVSNIQGRRPTHTARAIATAWNAFYGERPLVHLKVADETAPIKILGSPFDGREENREALKPPL